MKQTPTQEPPGPAAFRMTGGRMPSDAADRTAAALRLRAEQRLSQQQPSPLAEDEALRALHELQVHQIELQLQNEALQDSEAAAQEALSRLEELHHAMEERTQALERATTEARAARLMSEEANLQKDHFLAKVSHELRTPLQSMLGWSQLLLQEKTPPELAVRAAERIIHNVGLQARLIDDLLDISRILSGNLQLSFQQVSPLEIIERATCVVRGSAQEKGVTLDIASRLHTDARICTDVVRLEQVIWNLLRNAIHASSPGGRVELSVDSDESALHLSVKDWGAGIDTAEIHHIFEPFRQGAGIGSRRGGLGLGLTIVRHIVTLLSGEIQVRSAGAGQGAEFVVQLPIALHTARCLPNSPDPANARDSASLTGLRLAYVEDEPDIAESCALMLETLGAHVDACLTFEQGRHLMLRGGFDILLTDMKLDDGHTGTELLQVLRTTPHGRNMPALVLSAYGSEADRRTSVQSGFDRHLVKPIDADMLSRELRAVLGGDLSLGFGRA